MWSDNSITTPGCHIICFCCRLSSRNRGDDGVCGDGYDARGDDAHHDDGHRSVHDPHQQTQRVVLPLPSLPLQQPLPRWRMSAFFWSWLWLSLYDCRNTIFNYLGNIWTRQFHSRKLE